MLTRLQSDIANNIGTFETGFAVGVALRDVVKISSSDVVDKADATLDPEEPAIGVVVALNYPTTGRAIVRFGGLVTGFSGLTPGKRYILSKTSGEIVRSDDTGNIGYPDTLGDFVQTIGVALTASTLFVKVDLTTTAVIAP